jgi:peptidyl-prolyl cis-trans isomerase B (cyclophilin B)
MKFPILVTILLGVAALAAEDKKEERTSMSSSNEVAVIKTSEGDMVVQFWTDAAPKTIENFKKLARQGFYNGTIFHRIVKGFMIQGGDPNSKDPAKENSYGQGDPGYKIKAEFNDHPHDRGVLSMARSSDPDSAGSQFFICVTDQPPLDGKYTIFGRVAEGMDVVRKISESPAGADGVPNERITISSVAIRDTPPPEPEPFSTETAADLAKYRAVLETSSGPVTIEFFPDKAPEHVRNFLRLAQSGVFDGTAFHRVVRGFVVQGGALNTRGPLTE